MADRKLTELTGFTPERTDVLYAVDDPGGTPASGKVTIAQALGLLQEGDIPVGIQRQPAEGAFVDGDKTKLDGIEAGADVTDTTNVAAAGALMDSEVANLAAVKAFDPTDYATAAQGALAATAHSWGDHALQGYLTGYTVTQGDVTQHQAALTITESQISDLGAYLTAVAWADVTGKPTTFAPASHTHPVAEIDATGTPDGTKFLRGDGTWATPPGAGGGISNVVDDASPQLGGTLDANGNDIDMGTNAITDAKVGQWDTAFGWGDHAAEGYLTAVSQGDVTQHQAALTITESQISDLGSYLTTVAWGDVTGKPPVVQSDPSGVTGATAVTNQMMLTQAQYDAIGTPDTSTVYYITD